MHNIARGTYNGTQYSCMYDNNDKYCLVSEDERFYFHAGYDEAHFKNKSEEYPHYLLVFDMQTDILVYAAREDEFIGHYLELQNLEFHSQFDYPEFDFDRLDELRVEVPRLFSKVQARVNEALDSMIERE